MVNLHGRVALVTGAESGIGRASSAALAKAGATVAVCYYEDQAAAETTLAAVETLGADGDTIQLDISDEDSVAASFDMANATLGLPDILVNSAAINQSGVRVADMPLEQWDRLIRTDLTGAFLTCRRFIRDLSAAGKPGRIVNITSIHDTVVRAGGADYNSAKGGLKNLTKTLALECAPLRINVNAIAPGMILTPMNPRALNDPEVRKRQEAGVPWKRAGMPEEVAALVVYLASSDADYITGTTVAIDGGLSLLLGQSP